MIERVQVPNGAPLKHEFITNLCTGHTNVCMYVTYNWCTVILRIIARERVCQTFWLSVRVFVQDTWTYTRIRKHTLRGKSISTASFHVRTALSLSNSLPSFWKSVPGDLQAAVTVSQDTPAVDTQNTLIYLFVSLWRLLSFRPLKRAWAFLPLVPAPSFAYICLNACFVCVCILFCQQFRATPLWEPRHIKKLPAHH